MFFSLCSLHGLFSLWVLFLPSGEAEPPQHPVAPDYSWGRRLHSRVSHAKSPCSNKNYVQNPSAAHWYSFHFYCVRGCDCRGHGTTYSVTALLSSCLSQDLLLLLTIQASLAGLWASRDCPVSTFHFTVNTERLQVPDASLALIWFSGS